MHDIISAKFDYPRSELDREDASAHCARLNDRGSCAAHLGDPDIGQRNHLHRNHLRPVTTVNACARALLRHGLFLSVIPYLCPGNTSPHNRRRFARHDPVAAVSTNVLVATGRRSRKPGYLPITARAKLFLGYPANLPASLQRLGTFSSTPCRHDRLMSQLLDHGSYVAHLNRIPLPAPQGLGRRAVPGWATNCLAHRSRRSSETFEASGLARCSARWISDPQETSRPFR